VYPAKTALIMLLRHYWLFVVLTMRGREWTAYVLRCGSNGPVT
jgi:hypothetical protein